MACEFYRVKLAALHITSACSHRCPFCYASSSQNADAPDHNVLLRIIDAFAANSVDEVVFLGGDPCTYPQLLDLAEAAKSKGMVTTVLSNTHSYRSESPEVVTSLIDCFETTIHGPSAEDHDAIALRDGAFRTVLQALKALSRSARSIGVVYNITPQSARLLDRTIHSLIAQHGIPVDHLILQRIIPQGRARATSKFVIGCSQAIACLEELERLLAKHDLSILFEDPFPWCVVPVRFHKYLSRCEWGFSRAAVDAFGNVSRCGADPRYGLGNLLAVPLLELWNQSPILKSYRSRDYLPEECQTCGLLDRCGGGCALSCEIERDHGPDHLYYERLRTVKPAGLPVPDTYQVRMARRDDLSDILRLEWACFPGFEFRFSPAPLLKWFNYNPGMFCVLEDSSSRVCGYACVVPLTEAGHHKIREGIACSLQELTTHDVAETGTNETHLWHIEAIATTSDVRSRAGRTLIRRVGEFLLQKPARITASPITYIGAKLCDYFGFKKVATERRGDASYDVYVSASTISDLARKLERF